MESQTEITDHYLDDDGEPIKPTSNIRLPKGYQLLSTKKSPVASKKKVKELKDDAAKRRPATPPPGYLITSSPYATPDLTSNPKGEGLYEMYGRNGQGNALGSFKVPYSRVHTALTSGYTFYNGSDATYAKDKEAEGKPVSWYQQILQSPALQPVPHENPMKSGILGNKERAAARTILATPEYVSQLLKAAKSMHEGSVAGGDEFANLVNPFQIPKQMYDQFKEDAKTDPKMAVDNLLGNAVGLGVVGAVTHGVGEKATHALSGHPYTPIEQSDIPTRERTNVLHRNGAGEVRQAKGQAPAVWLSPDAWKSLMGELYPEEDASQTNGFNLPANDALLQFATEHKPVNANPTFTDVQKLLAEAHKGAGQGGVAIAKNRPSIAKNVNVLREELNHTWQRGLANGNVNQHLDPQAFTNLYHAIPSGLYDHLVENGYSGHNSPEMVAEAAVRMMDGRPEQFGVTEDEAVDFLDKYFKSVTEKHGAKALEELHHVRGIAADAKARAIEQHTGSGQDNQSVSGVVDGGQRGVKEGVQATGEQVNPAADGQRPKVDRSKWTAEQEDNGNWIVKGPEGQFIDGVHRSDAKTAQDAINAVPEPEIRQSPSKGKVPPSSDSSQKPLHEMSPDEVRDEYAKAKTRDKQDVIDIFGEEEAKRYNRLQRQANNSFDMQKADKAANELQEMESKLTPEQQNRLYGIGDTRHTEEELKEYHDAYQGIDDSSPDALGESLKWAVSQVGDPTRAPEAMTPKERLRFAQLRHGYNLAFQNGYDPMEVMKTAVKSAADRFSDPNDARYMLRDVVKALHIDEGGKSTPQLGTGQDENITPEMRKSVGEEGVPLFNRERRIDDVTRKRVEDMTPDEMRKALLTSDITGAPNRRAFDDAEHVSPAAAVGMSDADGLKALNDKFGYAAGNELLKAKAEALKAAGLDAYHEKGDEFLYRGESPQDLKDKLEKARNILRDRTIEVTLKDGKKLYFKGADFSYGTGKDLDESESGLKQHKQEREDRGERARGELRGITEVEPEGSEGDKGSTLFNREQVKDSDTDEENWKPSGGKETTTPITGTDGGTFDPAKGGTLFHGTSNKDLTFKPGSYVYLTAHKGEADSFAGNVHRLGEDRSEDANVKTYTAKPGKTFDINDDIDEMIMNGDDDDERAIMDAARKQGARYAVHLHPSARGEENYPVVISLYPQEDLVESPSAAGQSQPTSTVSVQGNTLVTGAPIMIPSVPVPTKDSLPLHKLKEMAAARNPNVNSQPQVKNVRDLMAEARSRMIP